MCPDHVISRHDDALFILDEAQESYGNAFLWNSIIKSLIDRLGGDNQPLLTSFCLFTSYGSPHEAVSIPMPGTTISFTPVIIPPIQCVSLTPGAYGCNHTFGLYLFGFSRDEMDEAISLMCKSADPRF
jgi:hypothetical protein